MRGLIEGLPSPHPLADALPAMLADDDFAVRLTAAFDEVLAPVFVSLDNFAEYLDPALCPEDFLAWLGEWVGAAVDPDAPVERRREIVTRAASLARRRGTHAGVAEQLALLTGGDPDVDDGGGVTWSASPGAPLPGAGGAVVRVRVRGELDAVDRARVESAISSAVPAHMTYEIEVVAP